MNETGIGARVINFLTDTIVIFFIALGLYKWWSFYVINWNQHFIPYYLFFGGTIFMYYTVAEGLFSRTAGKLLSLSRVRNMAGGRPSAGQILLRSLLRLTVIDCFFIPILGRPLHDALSKTRVVEV